MSIHDAAKIESLMIRFAFATREQVTHALSVERNHARRAAVRLSLLEPLELKLDRLALEVEPNKTEVVGAKPEAQRLRHAAENLRADMHLQDLSPPRNPATLKSQDSSAPDEASKNVRHVECEVCLYARPP